MEVFCYNQGSMNTCHDMLNDTCIGWVYEGEKVLYKLVAIIESIKLLNNSASLLN